MRAEYLRKTRKCAGNHRTWQNALFVQNLKHMFNFEQKNGFDGFPPLLEHCNWWYCPTSLFPCFRNYFVHLPCRCTFADFNVFCKSLPGRSMQLLQPGIPQLRPQSRLASNPSRGQSPQPLSKLPNLDMTSVSAYWSAASQTTQTRTTMMALKTLCLCDYVPVTSSSEPEARQIHHESSFLEKRRR